MHLFNFSPWFVFVPIGSLHWPCFDVQDFFSIISIKTNLVSCVSLNPNWGQIERTYYLSLLACMGRTKKKVNFFSFFRILKTKLKSSFIVLLCIKWRHNLFDKVKIKKWFVWIISLLSISYKSSYQLTLYNPSWMHRTQHERSESNIALWLNQTQIAFGKWDV